MTVTRARARVEGTVQGVGFRPHVLRLAEELGLAGWVRNDERGVELEVEGPETAVAAFARRFEREAPSLAVVERSSWEPRPAEGARGFEIRASSITGEASAPVTADTAPCAACLRELRDPADRRFRYPFITCTDCGPRLTIVLGVPYDRPRTTMAGFPMCAACRAEYEDPRHRRLHAQPIACPDCGPRARLLPLGPHAADGGAAAAVARLARAHGQEARPDAVAGAAAALVAGAIVAVKGLGGYHLACRADDEAVVARLRARKHREDKPFALMVADTAAAGALVELADADRAELESPRRPIVLAARRPDATIAPSVAPGLADLGIMLPSSPLHALLLDDTGGIPLVMTSGNRSDEPIAYEDDDARERLAPIADLALVHDRPIATRVDDSVVRTRAAPRPPIVLRRARGYVPAALALPVPAARPLLAVGAELKSAFCVAKGPRAWMSHHLGDLTTYEVLRSFRAGVAHFEALFAVTPQVVAHDRHPDYLSTREALDREGVDLVGVQHHHAHLAACLAEHGRTDAAVGAIYDGAGYGTDGTVWGGELLVGDLRGCERAGSLLPVALPGGDRAARQPWRMACSWLVAAGEPEPPLPPRLKGRVDPGRWAQVSALCRAGRAVTPQTTSAGRLFDAVAALCGLHAEITYEGQAAMALEARAARAAGARAYELPVTADGTLDPRPAITAVAADAAAGVEVAAIAAGFHDALAAATVEQVCAIASQRGLATAVLSGGVFANRRLLDSTADLLEAAGLEVLAPVRLPPGDGGIAYGQAAVAASLTL